MLVAEVITSGKKILLADLSSNRKSTCATLIVLFLCEIGAIMGRCEIDDVIMNTLGAFIGALGYLLFGHLTKERKV